MSRSGGRPLRLLPTMTTAPRTATSIASSIQRCRMHATDDSRSMWLADAIERTGLGTRVIRIARNLWHPDVIRACRRVLVRWAGRRRDREPLHCWPTRPPGRRDCGPARTIRARAALTSADPQHPAYMWKTRRSGCSTESKDRTPPPGASSTPLNFNSRRNILIPKDSDARLTTHRTCRRAPVPRVTLEDTCRIRRRLSVSRSP